MKKNILQQSLDTPTWQFSDGEGHSALSLLKGRWVRVKGKPRGILKSFNKSLARTKQTDFLATFNFRLRKCRLAFISSVTK